MGDNPVADGGDFGGRQPQSELGSPPYDVFGGQAHSDDIKYLTSLSVKVAPKDWPRSAIDFALPSSFAARVP